MMKRVVVVGTSGSGKTTLARQLSARLKLPHVELDELHWGPNWTPHEDFAQRVGHALNCDAWVVDGGYAVVRHLIWPPADTIVWLDFPMRVVFMQVLRRTLKRSWTQEPLWNGNRERLWVQFCSSESLLLWVINTWRMRRSRYPKLLREAQSEGKQIVRLRSPEHANAWLDRIC
jgi:adenylate kinase family enzyme